MPTTNPVPSTDPTDLLFNAGKLDEVVSGTSAYYTDRLGVNRRTIEGINASADVVLAGLGYAPPVAYTAGISLTLATQTVEYAGEVYAPKVADLPFTTNGTFETAKFRLIQGVASADLPALAGQDLQDYAALRAYTGIANRIYITGPLAAAKPAGFAGTFQHDPTDTTSLDNGGTIIVGSDGRRWKRDFSGAVNVKWFGAIGDGVTDDTAAVHAAINHAKGRRGAVFSPSGTYRVTSGYTQNTANVSIRIFGEGSARGGSNTGTTITLDSTSPSSFFYNATARSSIQVENISFTCAQTVANRPFFKFSAALHAEFFKDVSFELVERPIVWAAGSYFQNASFRDVQFSNGGTLHSESPNTASALVGTLLTLDNVNHEGTVTSANTEKVVCNLQGIRKIYASNFLLEGSLPETGWTILKLNNTYDPAYTREPFAEIYNFWSEWTANSPTYTIDQISGSVTISGHFGLSLTNKYKLSSKARANIVRSGFIYTDDEASKFFEFENGECLVSFTDCSLRKFDSTAVGFLHNNTQAGNTVDGLGQVVLSNTAASPIYEWSGGYLTSDGCTASFFSGSHVISTDASFGRKVVISTAAGALDAQIRVPSVIGNLKKGEQIVVCLKAKLPTFATGSWRFDVIVDSTYVALKYFDATYSGAVVDVVVPWVLTSNPTTNVGIGFSNGTTSGVSTTLEVYSMVIYHGNIIPRSMAKLYPTNIITKWVAAPSTGTWAAGDRVINIAPAVGSPKGWVCTVAGTPGTWVSEGNL